mgnify:CR=1 FL=1
MACLMTISACKAGPLPFVLSWWIFTFPLGIFVAESFRQTEVADWSRSFAIGVASGAIFQPCP